MLETTLIIRWLISVVVIILLLVGFYIVLKILKTKGFGKVVESREKKMQVLEQLHLDSKNKIVKVKDDDKVLTILLGSSANLIKEEKIKKIKEDV